MSNGGYIPNLFITLNNVMQRNKTLRKLKAFMYYVDSVTLCFIKKPKKEENAKKRVLIVYNLALGDGAVFSCALKNIREIYPNDEYEIAIASQKGLNKIYENLGIFDEVIPLNFSKATVNLKARREVFRKLREKYYDIVIDPIGPEECTTNVLMTRAVVGKDKISLINKDRKIFCYKHIYKNVYNQIIEIEGKDISLLEHYYAFFNKLSNANFKIEYTNLPSKPIEKDIPKEYFIIYPSASSTLKKWPVDRFAQIAKRIVEKTNLPLLLCGTGVDKEANDSLKALLPEMDILDLTDKTDILEFIDIVKKAKFVITNDTGIYHISVVSEVPVAITAGGYTYNRYLIYGFENSYKKPYITTKEMDCFNCENRCTRYKEMEDIWPCLDNISVENAWKVIEEMIDKEYLNKKE